jgi:hypothetical protein
MQLATTEAGLLLLCTADGVVAINCLGVGEAQPTTKKQTTSEIYDLEVTN